MIYLMKNAQPVNIFNTFRFYHSIRSFWEAIEKQQSVLQHT